MSRGRLLLRYVPDNRHLRWTVFWLLFGLLTGGGVAFDGLEAQAQSVVDSTRPALTHQLQATRAKKAPTIDGRLTEPIWTRADSATGFRQTRPSPGAPASRRTVAYVLYDDDYIYVGARMYDNPDSIAAQTMGRDEFGYTDRFVVSIGSYNDNRNAFRFRVGPSGSRVDGVISNDTNSDTSWDAVWTAETHVNARGWTAELRIPLSQLRYAPIPQSDTGTWGLNFQRDIARLSESVSWAPLDPNVNRQVSLYGSLRGLSGLSASRNLEFQPYTAGRVERPETTTALRSSTEWTGRIGGDVRYGLTPSVSLRATINPDFGQVEADPSRINLSAFETFFPEKRPFFVESADIFDIQEGPRLFYSRRIGRRPQGPVPDSAVTSAVPDRTTIVGAAKLTGRTAGDWEIGALEAVTAQEQASIADEAGDRAAAVVEPATNYAVGRVRRNLRGGRSTVGGIVTTVNRPGLEPRLTGTMHRSAYTGGVDGRHRFADETYEVSGSLLGSQVRGSPAALLKTQTGATHYFQRPDADHVSVDSSRTQLSGWRSAAEIEKVSGRWQWEASVQAESPGFEINDLGFLRQSDEVAGGARLSYNRTEAGNTFRRIRARVAQRSQWTFGGEPTGQSLFVFFGGTFRNNHSLNVGTNANLSALSTTQLRGGPALRENGRASVFANYNSDRRDALRVGLSANYGTDFGTPGRSYSLRPEARWRPTSRAEVSLEPRFSASRDLSQYVQRATDDGQPEYVFAEIQRRTLAVTTRASYAFSPELTLQVYAQPFIATGAYSDFTVVENPTAEAFSDRFAPLGDQASYDERDDTYRVDTDRDGQVDYSFADPDFTFQQLRSTVVVRWRYRRGSNLFFVWNRGRTQSRGVADFDPAGGLGDLFRGGGNTFAIKLDFWLGV